MMGTFLDFCCPLEVAHKRLASAPANTAWNVSTEAEPLVHRIHSYPAKFPAFLTSKALDYAREEQLRVGRLGDVFCGCGTVAYEARREGLEFWGCDINPVATLIARTKSTSYSPDRLARLLQQVLSAFYASTTGVTLTLAAEVRLSRWHPPRQLADLKRLLLAINTTVSGRSNLNFFQCAFSAILKPTSRWKQRSTKPNLDPTKKPQDVIAAFQRQCAKMFGAWIGPSPTKGPRPQIHQDNVMTIAPPRRPLDMIITSPPYVTSYEYADLHQLSSLWLGFTDDHRKMREGSIGSSRQQLNFRREFHRLNDVGMQVVFALYELNPRAASAIAKYYLDMQRVAERCLQFLATKGFALFVIGNTTYEGRTIDNASHLAESLLRAGFKTVRVGRRRISNKAHTPYRTPAGRFSTEATELLVYSEEYILIAHKS